MELATLADWASAVATFGAAGAALWIATTDRRDAARRAKEDQEASGSSGARRSRLDMGPSVLTRIEKDRQRTEAAESEAALAAGGRAGTARAPGIRSDAAVYPESRRANHKPERA